MNLSKKQPSPIFCIKFLLVVSTIEKKPTQTTLSEYHPRQISNWNVKLCCHHIISFVVIAISAILVIVGNNDPNRLMHYTIVYYSTNFGFIWSPHYSLKFNQFQWVYCVFILSLFTNMNNLKKFSYSHTNSNAIDWLFKLLL